MYGLMNIIAYDRFRSSPAKLAKIVSTRRRHSKSKLLISWRKREMAGENLKWLDENEKLLDENGKWVAKTRNGRRNEKWPALSENLALVTVGSHQKCNKVGLLSLTGE